MNEVVITPPVSEDVAEIQAEATETVSDAAVEIAQIEADRDVTIAEIHADTVTELAETEQDDVEWLETRLGELEARVGSRLDNLQSTVEQLLSQHLLILSNLEKLSILIPPSPEVSAETETVTVETPDNSVVAEVVQEAPRPRKKWLA